MKFATLALVALAVACSVIAVSAGNGEAVGCRRAPGSVFYPNDDQYTLKEKDTRYNNCKEQCNSENYSDGWAYGYSQCCCAGKIVTVISR
jgi:hypothetical protein